MQLVFKVQDKKQALIHSVFNALICAIDTGPDHTVAEIFMKFHQML